MPKSLPNFIFLILILGWKSIAYGQDPFFKRYEVDDGLPAQEIYCTFMDSKGYLWFGTDNGLSRFDGKNFELFNIETGMAMNTTYRMFEDSKGRIWANGIRHVSYFENEEWHNFVDDTTWGDIGINEAHRGFFEHPNGDIFIGTYSEGILVIRNNKKVERITFADEFENHISFFQLQDNGSVRCFYTRGWLDIHPKTSKVLKRGNRGDRFPRISHFYHSTDGSIFFSKEEDLFKYKDEEIINCIPKELKYLIDQINLVTKDRKGDLWLGTVNGAIRIKGGVFKAENITQYLKGERVSGIIQDWEGNYWFSTLDNGVYFTPSLAITFYDKLSYFGYKNLASVGGAGDGSIWVGSSHGRYAKLGTNGPEKFQLPLYPSEAKQILVKRIKQDPKGNLWLVADDFSAMLDREGNYKVYYSIGNLKNIFIDKEGNYFPASSMYAFKISPDELENMTEEPNISHPDWYDNYKSKNLSQKEIFKGWVNGILRDQQGRVWLGTSEGLYIQKEDSLVSMLEGLIQDDRHGGIMELEQTSSGAVVALLYQVGLFIFHQGKAYLITPEMGVPRHALRMFIDERDNLWFTSNEGLIKLSIGENRRLKVERYGMDDGLASRSTRDVFVKDEVVWATCSKGLLRLDLKTFSRSKAAPVIMIESVNQGTSQEHLLPGQMLSHNQNNIKINYKTISFRGRENLQYKYRLKGLSNSWNITQNPDVSFLSLSPGQYTFEVKARNAAGIWSESPAVFEFEVKPAIWQQNWFWILIFLLVTGLIWGLLFYRFQVLRERTQITRKMVESEQKALRAQMTPHFIFNSLNSIQQLISEENRVQALRFTSKFSRLMRRIMENSRQRFISLNEELETLRLYLDLEALRFEQKFAYEFDLDKNLDPEETEIPPMIIQPYVENSIWHGLLHKEGNDGLISIRLRKEGSYLVCHIEDNGIGRKASVEKKSEHDQKHVSAGMTLTRERLDLLNTMDTNKLSVKVVDLKNEEGFSAGTRIELHIPIDSD